MRKRPKYAGSTVPTNLVRLHDLRYTCATLMLCEGVHIKVVQELLGHADVTITLDTYSYVPSGMGGEAAGAMDRIFS